MPMGECGRGGRGVEPVGIGLSLIFFRSSKWIGLNFELTIHIDPKIGEAFFYFFFRTFFSCKVVKIVLMPVHTFWNQFDTSEGFSVEFVLLL
jgi:hypothetical protein